MYRVIKVKYLFDYKLEIFFDNSQKKIIDLKNELNGPIFEPLKNIDYFKTVKIDPDFDTICWDNGADFAPETLYEM